MDPADPAPPPGATAEGIATGRSTWGVRRDRGRRRIRRRQATALLLAYVALIGLVTLTPDSVDRGVYPYLMRGVVFVQHHGIPGFRYSMIEEVANVALFTPLGMLGVLALGAPRWWIVVLAGTAMSASVELAQGRVPAGARGLRHRRGGQRRRCSPRCDGGGGHRGADATTRADPVVIGSARVGSGTASGVRTRGDGGPSRCPLPRRRRGAARRR